MPASRHLGTDHPLEPDATQAPPKNRNDTERPPGLPPPTTCVLGSVTALCCCGTAGRAAVPLEDADLRPASAPPGHTPDQCTPL